MLVPDDWERCGGWGSLRARPDFEKPKRQLDPRQKIRRSECREAAATRMRRNGVHKLHALGPRSISCKSARMLGGSRPTRLQHGDGEILVVHFDRECRINHLILKIDSPCSWNGGRGLGNAEHVRDCLSSHDWPANRAAHHASFGRLWRESELSARQRIG